MKQIEIQFFIKDYVTVISDYWYSHIFNNEHMFGAFSLTTFILLEYDKFIK